MMEQQIELRSLHYFFIATKSEGIQLLNYEIMLSLNFSNIHYILEYSCFIYSYLYSYLQKYWRYSNFIDNYIEIIINIV